MSNNPHLNCCCTGKVKMIKFKYDENEMVLSTGKRLPATQQIIGINPDLQTFQGCDGKLYQVQGIAMLQNAALTQEEREELADEMIRRWQAFKELK